MRKWIRCIGIIAVILSLVACGKEKAENKGTTGAMETTQSKDVEETILQKEELFDVPEEEDRKGAGILIAYFAVAENSEVDAVSSASVITIDGEAKGRTRILADMIAAETNGDLFSILTSVDYPADGDALVDFAAEEQENNERPELTSQIKNLEKYDVIFIGYPNWWYDLPMVMYSFFDTYDFAGKTIIPFCTHNGSRFSSTIETIQELEPNAAVITDGFTVNEHDVEEAAEKLISWLHELGY